MLQHPQAGFKPTTQQQWYQPGACIKPLTPSRVTSSSRARIARHRRAHNHHPATGVRVHAVEDAVPGAAQPVQQQSAEPKNAHKHNGHTRPSSPQAHTHWSAKSKEAFLPMQNQLLQLQEQMGQQSEAAAGKLQPHDYLKFVQFFRHASPYIAGHRGRTFVIVVPGSVTSDEALLRRTMSDIAQLHSLGVRLVLVVGAQNIIDNLLRQRGIQPAWVGGHRVTNHFALRAAVEAAGQVRINCEQFLSRGPAIPMIRRHTKGAGEENIHFEPAMRVVSGNYVAAKRRGVIAGVDFGYTGEVRFVLKDDIHRQLDLGNVVLLSNLGFSAGGDVLNCNTFEVGLHAALALGADKLFNIHTDEVSRLELPQWLPLSDAQEMLVQRLQTTLSSEEMDNVRASMNRPEVVEEVQEDGTVVSKVLSPAFKPTTFSNSAEVQTAWPADTRRIKSRLASNRRNEILMDLDTWSVSGYPPAVSSSVVACCRGVKRAHLLDARLDGGLLLELYSRDGVGTMISADFYEGIRKAGPGDLDAIIGLLKPLEEAGVLVKRSKDDLANLIPDFTVVERETKVMGCALLLNLGYSEDGVLVGELGAFCVDPVFRGSGRGDSLLDYVEQDARANGIERLVLLTTRTADWFEQRDFKLCGPAALSNLLPEQRRERINPARNSQLYVKKLEPPEELHKPPGKRIGF